MIKVLIWGVMVAAWLLLVSCAAQIIGNSISASLTNSALLVAKSQNSG